MLGGVIPGSAMPFPRAQILDTTRRRPRRCSRARSGDTGSAESATGYYWGEKKLRPFVETIRARAEREGDERLAQLAERFLR
jgi:hypothetical protein